ncbi:hypothetical protein ACKKBG_A08185 [Auxenochlorella protothecoides x Auxenochlorella symbiontica]|uniref:Uncharacterized protein n=1 Tax=Auxenochlorella protothecoides TaxID=3075 RepID=A0A1D2AFS6_AUXPR
MKGAWRGWAKPPLFSRRVDPPLSGSLHEIWLASSLQAFVQDWALRQELQSPDPEAKTEAVEDTKANIKSEAETDSVQVATAPPAPLLPFMSDVLMDFDMDSNF